MEVLTHFTLIDSFHRTAGSVPLPVPAGTAEVPEHPGLLPDR